MLYSIVYATADIVRTYDYGSPDAATNAFVSICADDATEAAAMFDDTGNEIASYDGLGRMARDSAA